jgi:heat shock protein HslJ
LNFAIRVSAAALTALTLAACGTTNTLNPTDTAAAAVSGVQKTLHVAPSRVECTGVAPQMCLQVRETTDAPWSLLYQDIVGFDYEPGYSYVIRIQEEVIANPPADASSIRRTLVSVLDKTAAPLSLIGSSWRLVAIEGREALPGTKVTAVFANDERVAGSAGCNHYFGRAAATNGTLAIGRLGTTLMHCGAAGVMEQERAYLGALEGATTYRVVGAELQLGPAEGVVTLGFRAE